MLQLFMCFFAVELSKGNPKDIYNGMKIDEQ